VDHRRSSRRKKLLLAKETGAAGLPRSGNSTARLTPLFGQDEKEEYDVNYGAHPGEILVRTNKLGDFRRIYRWVGKKLAPVTSGIPTRTWATLNIDRARKHIYYGRQRRRLSRAALRSTPPPTNRRRCPPSRTPIMSTSFPPRAMAASRVVNVEDRARRPAASYVYDWASKKLTEWMIPSAPRDRHARLRDRQVGAVPRARRNEDSHAGAASGKKNAPTRSARWW